MKINLGWPSDLRRRRVAAVKDWTEKGRQAQPGEVWTYSYISDDPACGTHFEEYIAGPVQQRGKHKCLGEGTLTMPQSPWFNGGHPPTRYRLTRGDVAPILKAHPGSGDVLRDLPRGVRVTVEYRPDAEVYGPIRIVVIGDTGGVKDFRDGQGPGRDVGDAWVQLSQVSGVEVETPEGTGARHALRTYLGMEG